MKALILAGGRGKRLKGDDPSADGNKCMTPVNGKPVIEFSLDSAAATTVDEIVVVVGHKAEDIVRTYGDRYRSKPLRYAMQAEQRGLVHAIECARDQLEGHDFVLFLGDEVLLNPRHQAMLDAFHAGADFAICGVLHVDDTSLIRRTYAVLEGDDHRIHRLIEKPRNPLNHTMGTGDCVFRNGIFDYIELTPIHPDRREKELPDLVQRAIDDGRIVRSFQICDRYANINSDDDLAFARAFFP